MLKNFITNFTENWYIYAAFLCAVIYFIQRIVEFIGYPTAKKEEQVKSLLLNWIREAEAALGSQTGKYKLSLVYEKFTNQFPNMAKWITIEKFDEWVKEALEVMENSFTNETTKNNALQIKTDVSNNT